MAITAPPVRPDEPARPTRPPLWRDVRVVRAGLQFVFAIAVLALVAYLYRNLIDNLQAQGIRTDFGHLDQPAGFQIAGSDFRASQTVGEALRVGVTNTAVIAVVGIVLATILGIVVGVARLSTNWLVRRAAGIYVEALRNLPPVLVIIFMFTAVFLRFPQIENPRNLFDLVIISNRTISLAWPVTADGAGPYLVVVALAALAAVAVAWWRTRRWNEFGEPHHRLWWALGVFAAVAVPAYFLFGGPVVLDRPEVVGRQLAGGIAMSANHGALLAALVIYTASYIAEIVRGSIQSVVKGQTEAATALALTPFQRLRFVVLPQAFRVAIPPTANQYLNLTKNSSLGFFIAFPEITTVTFIAIGNGNPAPQSILILMGIYLAFSLSIAAVTNLINRRMQLVGR
jgi:general L-amino acid transport system permease protein